MVARSASRESWSARFRLNPTDFYDLFGPTKTSRKGHSLGLGYHKTLVYDRPRQVEEVLVAWTEHRDVNAAAP